MGLDHKAVRKHVKAPHFAAYYMCLLCTKACRSLQVQHVQALTFLSSFKLRKCNIIKLQCLIAECIPRRASSLHVCGNSFQAAALDG